MDAVQDHPGALDAVDVGANEPLAAPALLGDEPGGLGQSLLGASRRYPADRDGSACSNG